MVQTYCKAMVPRKEAGMLGDEFVGKSFLSRPLHQLGQLISIPVLFPWGDVITKALLDLTGK